MTNEHSMLDIAVWQYGGEELTLPLRHTAILPYSHIGVTTHSLSVSIQRSIKDLLTGDAHGSQLTNMRPPIGAGWSILSGKLKNSLKWSKREKH